MANIQKYNRDLDRSLDRFFDDFFGDWAGKTMKIPPVDIEERDKEYVIKAEVPGFEEESIRLYVENHILHIAGEMVKEEKSDKKYLLRERKSQSFERTFALPEGVEEENLKADYGKGVLTITVPKAVKAEPKKIEVKINK